MSKFLCFLFLLLPVMAFSQTVAECDFFYSQRGIHLLAAQDCYEKIHDQKLLPIEDSLERSFTNLSTAVVFFEKKAEERLIIDKAFLVLDQTKAFYGENAYYNYWKAVWISFDALEKDRGKLIPTYLFSQIGTIQNLLKSALNEDPSIHFFGPHRVLGVLHTQMPKIAGGDKKYAEQMLKISFTARPHGHSNPYAYANILYINGRSAQAQVVLNDFLATPNSVYEPYPNDNLRSLNIEIEIEKKKAQELLNTISDEE